MNPTQIRIGERVYFGRTHGEKTLGRVLKVNAKSISVVQLEARGGHAVGTKWRVGPKFVFPEAGIPLHAPAPVGLVEEAPPPRTARPEPEILRDILGCYVSLSPENLYCDGELTRAQASRRAAVLRAKLKGLFAELGRTVTEEEAWATGLGRAV